MRLLQKILVGSVGVCLLINAANAQTDWFFDGSTANPGDWNDPLNWDRDTVPMYVDPSNAIIGHDVMGLSTATANISGLLTESVIGDLRIGATGAGGMGGSDGTVNQSAGALSTNAGNWAFVGLDGPPSNPNKGTYNLSGSAVFTNDAQMHVGIGGGAGAGNQGIVSVADSATMNLNELYVGSNDNNIGSMTQSGGTINANRLFIGDATFGIGATGSFEQTGGDVVVQEWMVIGRQQQAMGTYNISGGSLFVGNDYLTVGEATGAVGMMTVSNNAMVDVGNLGVGRFSGGSQGTLRVEGDQATISVANNFQVGIDDGAGLVPTDSTGTLEFVSSTASVTAIDVAGVVYLNDGTVTGNSFLNVDFSTASTTGDITLVNVLSSDAISGTFSGLPEGALVPNSGGRTITYVGGTGNDIVLLEGSGMVACDLNGDGDCDIADLRQLYDDIDAMAMGANSDLDGNNITDNNDIDDWLTTAGAFNGKTYLEGDTNLDGNVNGPDFTNLAVNFGNVGLPGAYWDEGNFNGNADGTFNTGGADFTDLALNFGFTSVTSAVPEPSAVTLLLTAILACLQVARRKK